MRKRRDTIANMIFNTCRKTRRKTRRKRLGVGGQVPFAPTLAEDYGSMQADTYL